MAAMAANGTPGNDIFQLSPADTVTITGYDAAGQDVLGIHVGPGGFSLVDYVGGPTLRMVDASAWWNSIAGAQVVRWTGDPGSVDTAAEVDGLLQAMPGSRSGGVLFIGDAPGDAIGVYYDSNPAQAGGTSLVATLEGLSATTALDVSDFRPVNPNPGPVSVSIGGASGPNSTLVNGVVHAPEGTSGSSTILSFNVHRSGDLAQTTTVDYVVTSNASVSGAGASGADFAGGSFPSGTITIAPGEAFGRIAIPIVADASAEPDEGYTVTLTNSSATITSASRAALITNDDAGSPPPTGGGAATGTGGDDSFTLSPSSNLTITGYDASGQDVLAVPMGSGGFSLASYSGATTFRMVDASASWNSIAGAQVVRWTGDPSVVDTAAEADALLQSMPGNTLGGVLLVGDAPGDRIAVYYDAQPNVAGGIQTVATLEGLLSTTALGAGDFKPFTPNPGPANVSISVGSNAGGTTVNGALSVPEGDSGSRGVAYYVSRNGDQSQTVTVDYVVTTNTGTSGAGASASDFAGGAFPTGSVTFAPGEGLKEIFIPVAGDTAFEPDEGYAVTISSRTATVNKATQTGLIANDDTSGGSPPGGGSGTSGNDTFTLSPSSNLVITGYDAAGQDVLGIPTGSGGFSLAGYSGQASLTVVDASAWWTNISTAQVVRWTGDPASVDTAAEVDGLLQAMPGNGGGGRLFIGGATGGGVGLYYDASPAAAGGVTQVATLEGVTATTALTAGDFKPQTGTAPPPPNLSLAGAGVSHIEGDTGSTAYVFTVSRSGDLSGTSTANWSVSGGGPLGLQQGPASASDFVGGILPSGSVSFAPGQSTASITVNVAGDTTPEPDEVFTVRLSDPVGATTSNSPAIGTITTDDPGRLVLGPKGPSKAEGTGGSTDFVFTVTRVDSAEGAASVEWRVTTPPNGGATGSDFAGGALPSGVVTFADGQASAQFTVSVAGDGALEPDEAFGVGLFNPVNAYFYTFDGATTATILNDDSGAPPTGPTTHTGPTQTGTAGDDIFSLSSAATMIFNFDAAGQDALGLRSGAGGFQLADHSGQGDLTMVDASAWWNGIGGAQVVRWTGDPTVVDTAAEVDALLEAMPGNGGGGRLFIGGAAGGKVGVYYDADPLVRGNTSLIATIDNLTDPRALIANDFHLFA